MTRALLLFGCLLWLTLSSVESQSPAPPTPDPTIQECGTTTPWNYDMTELAWEFTSVADPHPSGFRVKFGTAAGVYTVTRDVPGSQFSLALTAALPGPGSYYAVVLPLYGTQEGGPSNECFFSCIGTSIRLGLRLKP